MSCKKGGFISVRYNNLRNLTAKMLSDVYKDTGHRAKINDNWQRVRQQNW